MTTILPQDANDNPIPALRFKENGAHKISFSGTSTTNVTSFDPNTKVVSLYSDQDVYITFGAENTITATSSAHFLPAGIYYDIALGGDVAPHYKYIAALQASTAGTLHISEKE